MSNNLTVINEMICICDEMIEYTSTHGGLYGTNKLYHDYKNKLDQFNQVHKDTFMNSDYGPLFILNKFTGCSYWTPSAITVIREALIQIKHEQFPKHYERIFISHREKDKPQTDALITLLHDIGIESNGPKKIFCSSHSEYYIKNGERNLDEIKKAFNSHHHTLYIMWYTDNFFESKACLNEAGAIFIMNKKYFEILSPEFDNANIGGLTDKQSTWFKADNIERLNIFKEQIEDMFSLPPIAQNRWEGKRKIGRAHV